MSFLDTDVLIELQRQSPMAVAWAQAQSNLRFQISGIAAMELAIGSRDKIELARALKFVSALDIAYVTESDNILAISLMRQYTLMSGLGLADFLIAAQAMNRDLRLYSFNIKHFSVIEGLDCQAPFLRAH